MHTDRYGGVATIVWYDPFKFYSSVVGSTPYLVTNCDFYKGANFEEDVREGDT